MTNEVLSAMKFAEAVRSYAQYDAHAKYTENGAYALDSSLNSVLDLFALIGAMRNRSVNLIDLIDKAYYEDPLLTTRIIFYARDIRGGLGERNTFRVAIKHLAETHPEAIINNIKLIPEYGRYDDLYYLIGTPLEDEMWTFMKDVYNNDLANVENNKKVTLLAKWLKTPDTSSKASRKLAGVTAKKLGYPNTKLYTIHLRMLRKYIKVTEVDMSANKWTSINYETVPSRAAMIYRAAFERHDSDRYRAYINAVNDGKATIHAGTLYPYDIYEKVMRGNEYDPTMDALWNSLPNYVTSDANALVMADVSGSMRGRPMATAVSLALYFAERNKGPFANLFMTFSSRPQFVEIKGTNLHEKLKNIQRADWGNNTDFAQAFRRILQIAVNSNCKQEELPKSLIVISDMEFDAANGFHNFNIMYDDLAQAFADKGYKIPNVVFWNVNARSNTFHATSEQKGVQLVSGSSPSSFKSLISAIDMTPVEYMLSVINSGRYNDVTVEEAE